MYLIIDDNHAYVSNEVDTASHGLAAVSDGWRHVFKHEGSKFLKMHVYLSDRGSYFAYRYEWIEVGTNPN